MEYQRKPNEREVAGITRRLQAAGPTELSLGEFCEVVRKGRTWVGGTFTQSGSGWGEFVGQRLFALDIDNATDYPRKDGSRGKRPLRRDESGHLSAREALERCERLDLAVVCLYETLGSTDECERFRIVVDAGETIVDQDEAREIIAWLLGEFPEADKSCKNPNRLFYGSTGKVLEVWSGERLTGDRL
jgi:hypothetical protein